MALTPKDRARLRSEAQKLKPIHHVGREGITDAVIDALGEAFNQRELLKVKVHEASAQPAREAGPIFAERLEGVEHVQTIGRTVVLYRPRPAEEG